jgi:two-component system, OmpR family, alkaline phosphatase synthesis response regulator PhoP
MKRVLIVEDDEFLASALQAKLLKYGYGVEVIGDGVEVAKILNKYIPDLILLDLVLPKMDGFAVLEMLKKDENYKRVPVVVLTNLSQDEDYKKAQELGATDYLVKIEMNIKDVAEKIKKYL